MRAHLTYLSLSRVINKPRLLPGATLATHFYFFLIATLSRAQLIALFATL